MNKTSATASVAFMGTRDQYQQLCDLRYKKADINKMTPQQIQDILKLHGLGHSKADIAAMTPDQVHAILNPPQSDQGGEDFNIDAIIDDKPFAKAPHQRYHVGRVTPQLPAGGQLPEGVPGLQDEELAVNPPGQVGAGQGHHQRREYP